MRYAMLVFLALLLFANAAFAAFCYQETANVSTACGGLATGAYYFENWNGSTAPLWDGNWAVGTNWTFNNASPSQAAMYVNYTIPYGTINATWVVKDEMVGVANISINGSEGCNLTNTLNLVVFFEGSIEDGFSRITYACEVYGGTISLLESDNSTNQSFIMYEEAVNWTTNGSTVTSCLNGTVVDYLPCTINNASLNFTVSSSLVINGDNGITINATGVKVDCLGNALIGNNSSATIGFYTNKHNTTLANCNVRGFSTNIQYSSLTDGVISNVNSTQSKYTLNLTNADKVAVSSFLAYSEGVATGYAGALSIVSGSRNTFSSSTFSAAATLQAILHTTSLYLYNASLNTFNLVFSDDGSTHVVYNGADLEASHNNTFNNSAINGTSYGIQLNRSNGNILLNSVFFGVLNGVSINGSDSNAATNVTGEATQGGGYYLKDSRYNTVASSQIISNAGSQGALFLMNSSHNTFTSNNLTQNGGAWCIYAQNPSAAQNSTNNTFLENSLYSDQWVLSNNGAINIFSNTTVGNKYYTATGVPASDFKDILCDPTHAPCYASAGEDLPFNSTTVSAYWIGLGEDSHPYSLYEKGGAGGVGCVECGAGGGGGVGVIIPAPIIPPIEDIPLLKSFGAWLDVFLKEKPFGIPFSWIVVVVLLLLLSGELDGYLKMQKSSSGILSVMLVFITIWVAYNYIL